MKIIDALLVVIMASLAMLAVGILVADIRYRGRAQPKCQPDQKHRTPRLYISGGKWYDMDRPGACAVPIDDQHYSRCWKPHGHLSCSSYFQEFCLTPHSSCPPEKSMPREILK